MLSLMEQRADEANWPAGFQEGRWRVIVVSAAGSAHVRADLPCDDTVGFATVGRSMLAVISDGAGSAERGRDGSAILVDAVKRGVVEALQKREGEVDPPTADEAFWREIIEQAIESAREAVLGFANNPKLVRRDGEPLRLTDFHATLVGFVVSEETGLFFHIGDGFAATFDVERTAKDGCIMKAGCASYPHVGDYAGQTYFFSMENWRRYLRLALFKPQAHVFAMSDGVSAFALSPDRFLNEPFLCPVEAYLSGVKPSVGATALSETLTCEQAERVCDDDKSIVWISREVQVEIEERLEVGN